LSCDGSGVSNLTQTDSLSADITFYVEQARNNPDFVCPFIEKTGAGWPTTQGAVLKWQAEGRFGGTSTWELGVGNNTQNSAMSANTNHVWGSSPTTEDFSVVYDGSMATFTVGSESVSYSVGTGTMNRKLYLIGRASSGASDTVKLTDLVLNGGSLSSFVNAPSNSVAFLQVSGFDFSNPFTVTGKVTLDYTSGSTAGSSPAFQVMVAE
jgi:hypothetical protein